MDALSAIDKLVANSAENAIGALNIVGHKWLPGGIHRQPDEAIRDKLLEAKDLIGGLRQGIWGIVLRDFAHLHDEIAAVVGGHDGRELLERVQTLVDKAAKMLSDFLAMDKSKLERPDIEKIRSLSLPASGALVNLAVDVSNWSAGVSRRIRETRQALSA